MQPECCKRAWLCEHKTGAARRGGGVSEGTQCVFRAPNWLWKEPLFSCLPLVFDKQLGKEGEGRGRQKPTHKDASAITREPLNPYVIRCMSSFCLSNVTKRHLFLRHHAFLWYKSQSSMTPDPRASRSWVWLRQTRTDGRTEGRTDTDNYSNPPAHARRGLINVDGYKWIGQNRNKLAKNAVRGSGGVGLLVKEGLYDKFNINVWDSSYEGILWVRFEQQENS